VSDIDTAVVDSLKALDPERPIREADNSAAPAFVRYWSNSGHAKRVFGEPKKLKI
jgi:hypothetical protein